MMKELDLKRKIKRRQRGITEKRRTRKRKKLKRERTRLTGTPGNDIKRPKRRGGLNGGGVTDRK